MHTSLRIPLPTMFQEDDYILSLSTQGGTTLEENNVSFTQFPDLFTTNADVLNFSSQMFEDFIDDPELLQFDDGGVLDFDDGLDSIFNSPMLDSLIKKECTLDSLNVNSKAEGTYNTTFTAVRSLNRFWNTHEFDAQVDPLLFSLKSSYTTKDGFEALCYMFHNERNILLSHYVVKLVPDPSRQKKGSKKKFLTGGAKRIYLNGIQRGLKLYEKQYNLVWRYGRDWSWSTDVEYQQLNAALDQKITELEFESNEDHSSQIMSLQQFRVLKTYTWELANKSTLPFPEQLLHMQRYLMQGVLSFGCLRARDDLAWCRTDEFTVLSPHRILFDMKRKFKSHKITSEKKVVKKPSRFIEGEEYVKVYNLIVQHRPTFPEELKIDPQIEETDCPTEDTVQQSTVQQPNIKKAHKQTKHTPPHLRLWLKIIPDCQESDPCYFTQELKAEKKVADAVSAYIPHLRQTHPLFAEPQKFTNTSLRKFHTDALSEAGAPIIVQQESLAQNTKAYAKKASHVDNKEKVAQIVAGSRATWHSPVCENKFPPTTIKSLPFKKRKIISFSDVQQKENIPPVIPTTPKHFSVKFSSGDTTFEFEHTF